MGTSPSPAMPPAHLLPWPSGLPAWLGSWKRGDPQSLSPEGTNLLPPTPLSPEAGKLGEPALARLRVSIIWFSAPRTHLQPPWAEDASEPKGSRLQGPLTNPALGPQRRPGRSRGDLETDSAVARPSPQGPPLPGEAQRCRLTLRLYNEVASRLGLPVRPTEASGSRAPGTVGDIRSSVEPAVPCPGPHAAQGGLAQTPGFTRPRLYSERRGS